MDEVAEGEDTGLDRRPRLAEHGGLSPRELEVLTHIGTGLTVSQIAEMLGLSVKTISTYRGRVLEKLLTANLIDSGSTTALIRYGLKTGLVQ